MTRRPPSTRSPAWPPRSTARSRDSGTDALSERPERRRRWGASHRRRFHFQCLLASLQERLLRAGRRSSDGLLLGQLATCGAGELVGQGLALVARVRDGRRMSASRLSNPVVRRVLRSLALWTLGQLALIVVGRLAARRLDSGDETSTDIRRVYVMNGE